MIGNGKPVFGMLVPAMSRQKATAKLRKLSTNPKNLHKRLSARVKLKNMTVHCGSSKNMLWIMLSPRQSSLFVKLSTCGREASSMSSILIIIWLTPTSKARRLATEDQLLSLCERYGFDQAPLLKEIRQFERAGDTLAEKGEDLQAIDSYLSDTKSSSQKKAARLLRTQWWRALPLGTRQVKGEILEALEHRTDQCLDKLGWRDEVYIIGHTLHLLIPLQLCMFRMIAKNDIASLLQLGKKFFAVDNIVAGLRSLFHVFQTARVTEIRSAEQVRAHMASLRELGSALHQFLRTSNATSVDMQNLLGYVLLPNNREAKVSPASLIVDYLSSSTDPSWKTYCPSGFTEQDPVIISGGMGPLIRKVLTERFAIIMEQQCRDFKSSPVFMQICKYYIRGACSSPDCLRLHVPAAETTTAASTRFKLFMQLFILLNDLPAVRVRRLRR